MMETAEKWKNITPAHVPWAEVTDGESTLRLLFPHEQKEMNMLVHGGWEQIGIMRYRGELFMAFEYAGPKGARAPLAI